MIDNKYETLNLFFVSLQTPKQKILDGLVICGIFLCKIFDNYPSFIIYVCLCKI